MTFRPAHPFYAPSDPFPPCEGIVAGRGVAQLARAPVSKTGGWGFETLHPCQFGMAGFGIGQGRDIPDCRSDAWLETHGSVMRVAFHPSRFVRDVRSEVTKVTWPSRKETLMMTGMVVAMATLAAVFFFIADQVIGIGVRLLFGVWG